MANVQTIEIPVRELYELVGWKKATSVRKFNVFNEEQYGPFLDFNDLYPQRYFVDPDNISQFHTRRTEWDKLDEEVRAYRRREQAPLRRELLEGKRFGTCALCGNIFPDRFLVAAHIKKREIANSAERQNIPYIAMLACVFGCDSLFEEGYTSFDDHGTLIVSKLSKREKFMEISKHLESLSGRSLPREFFEPRKEYFRWHRNRTFREEIN